MSNLLSDHKQLPLTDLMTGFKKSMETQTDLLLVLSKRKKSQDNLENKFPAKLTIRPVIIKKERLYQYALTQGRQEIHQNLPLAKLLDFVEKLLRDDYQHAHFFTTTADYEIRKSSDDLFKIRQTAPSKTKTAESHNRNKQYLIPEGTPCSFLIEMGVMTSQGKVKQAKYHKFRQINRFLELVNDIYDKLPATGSLNIVDFGSGKSYLTFAIYHLLHQIHQREVHILGIDNHPQIVQTCNRLAQKLAYQNLRFQQGDIAEVEIDDQVHLAVSLHACDTATDDALSQAVSWKSDVILAVPCCQKEVQQVIGNQNLTPLLKHGILKERTAALVTDALRSQLLEFSGYEVQTMEFIDLEHTPKNLLIRAIRKHEQWKPSSTSLQKYQEFKQLWGLKELYLEQKLLGQDLKEAYPS